MGFTAASSFFQRVFKVYRINPTYFKILILCAAGGGGFATYAVTGPINAAIASSDQDGEMKAKKKKVVIVGTGWAGTSFLKNLDSRFYDVQIISPRNYFAFTPLLPSVTCGTVDARSIVEPIRKIMKKKTGDIRFWEAECFKIDEVNKKVHCRSDTGTNLEGNGEFSVEYDYLVVAMGARSNTFNTPGVVENCHFLKEVEDAQKIRRSVMDCFEMANIPNQSDDEKRKKLHFIIVGGGPTGVEFAAELHDFVDKDISRLYPGIEDFVKISVIEAGQHILPMFDKTITQFAEHKFEREGIDLKLGHKVIKVSDQSITMSHKESGEISVPYGMVVWSTGIGTRPVISDFMNQIGQGDRRVLATDEWLRVKGCDDVYALGDCATIVQRRIVDDISAIFKIADKNNTGKLSLKEIQGVLVDICQRYPQMELYLKSKNMKRFSDLLNKVDDDLDIVKFKNALSSVDSHVKSLPATAQVAEQQGKYLARCFNLMKAGEVHSPKGPIRITADGRHRFPAFKYKHYGQFAPLGGEQTAAHLAGDWISIGHGSQWLWYSVYATKQPSWRTTFAVVSDWARRFVFGRDSSCI